jgi:hypothetical protein
MSDVLWTIAIFLFFLGLAWWVSHSLAIVLITLFLESVIFIFAITEII